LRARQRGSGKVFRTTGRAFAEGTQFFVGEVVKPSGKGRTATWDGMVGTVVRVEGASVFVQWHNVAVEDELGAEELVSTGTFQKRVPHLARVLDGSEDGELVTFDADEDEKKSSS